MYTGSASHASHAAATGGVILFYFTYSDMVTIIGNARVS